MIKATINGDIQMYAVPATVEGSIDYRGNASMEAHLLNRDNPHKVTPLQLGLDKVDNTADKDKPLSDAVSTALNGKLGTKETAYDSERLGTVLAADFWNKHNSNLPTIDWSAKNLDVIQDANIGGSLISGKVKLTSNETIGYLQLGGKADDTGLGIISGLNGTLIKQLDVVSTLTKFIGNTVTIGNATYGLVDAPANRILGFKGTFHENDYARIVMPEHSGSDAYGELVFMLRPKTAGTGNVAPAEVARMDPDQFTYNGNIVALGDIVAKSTGAVVFTAND